MVGYIGMSTITLETTEKLARAPFPVRKELPDTLQQTVERLQREKELTDDLSQTSNPAALIYAEVFDFLATKPGPEQIVEFAVSSALQERIED